MKTIHVVPKEDTEPHFFHGACTCRPDHSEREDDLDGTSLADTPIVFHHKYGDTKSSWLAIPIDDTDQVEYIDQDAGTTMTHYRDVDGTLQENWE